MLTSERTAQSPTSTIEGLGADLVVSAMASAGIDTCFANPGTSELHLVAALDRTNSIRSILTLFEGVATGAADGYARMLGRPASTLLHLGPGLANGLANLHNASRAHSAIVNLIGDHATYHLQYDPPLAADIEGLARPYSSFVRTVSDVASVASDVRDAVAGAWRYRGKIATLVLPTDIMWTKGAGECAPVSQGKGEAVDDATVSGVAEMLRSARRPCFLLGGQALLGTTLAKLAELASLYKADMFAAYGTARVERGAGRPLVERIPFAIDVACRRMAEFDCMVLIGARPPVAFFAYPNMPSTPLPAGCRVTQLAGVEADATQAVDKLHDLVNPPPAPSLHRPLTHASLDGQLDPDTVAAVLAGLIPEGAIIVDESATSGRSMLPATTGSAPHDWLFNPGGSIGMGLPVGLGAAIARPDRRVVCLQGDGGAAYTAQALWTMAREKANVTVIVFANRAYKILKGELAKFESSGLTGAASDLLDIDRPTIMWENISRGFGVPAYRVDTLAAFAEAFRDAGRQGGPSLIEVVL